MDEGEGKERNEERHLGGLAAGTDQCAATPVVGCWHQGALHPEVGG